jgi:hypothetical protein
MTGRFGNVAPVLINSEHARAPKGVGAHPDAVAHTKVFAALHERLPSSPFSLIELAVSLDHNGVRRANPSHGDVGDRTGQQKQ